MVLHLKTNFTQIYLVTILVDIDCTVLKKRMILVFNYNNKHIDIMSDTRKVQKFRLAETRFCTHGLTELNTIRLLFYRWKDQEIHNRS